MTFTPTDAANYTGAAKSVSIEVGKATPVITWRAPAGIAYGTALGATQLNATATVPGTFIYDPPPATVLEAGGQTLSVTFTPTDAANYTRRVEVGHDRGRARRRRSSPGARRPTSPTARRSARRS